MPKQPQDHKTKAGADAADETPECFSFNTVDGAVHTLAPTMTKLNPGFIRKNRRNASEDAIFTLLELLADDEALEAYDNLPLAAGIDVLRDFGEHVKAKAGVSLGE